MDPARLPEGVPADVLLGVYLRSGHDTLDRLAEAVHRAREAGGEAALAEVRRLSHNFKGASCQLGFDEVGRLAAALEQYSAECLRGGRFPDLQGFERMERAVQGLQAGLRSIEEGTSAPDLSDVAKAIETEEP